MDPLSRDEVRVISSIDEGDIVDLTRKLIDIPSVNPPGNEKPVAELIARYLSKFEIDADVREVLPGRPNVVASIEGESNERRLIFDGHMDVVPAGEGWDGSAFQASIVGGKIIGRGASDMKGGLAAMITAITAIKKAGLRLRGELLLQAVVDEEVACRGIKSIIKEGLKADYAIVGEPTQLSICIAHKGRLGVKITAYGEAAHASTPSNGVNAISAMVEVINQITSYGKRLESRCHPILGKPTQAVTMIKGGINHNIIPSECTMVVDRRLIPGETIEGVEEDYRRMIDEAQAKGVSFKVDFPEDITSLAGPLETPIDDLVVKILQSVTREVTGESKITGFPATTEAYFLDKAGVSTVVFGPGNINQAHRPNEYVEVKELVQAAKIYALTAIRLLEDREIKTSS